MQRSARWSALLVLSAALAGCAGGSESANEPIESLPPNTEVAADTTAATAAATASETNAAGPSHRGHTTPPARPADPLLAVELTDVRSGETFTLGELATSGPVLLESMAVWCSNCRAQQHEVARAHEAGGFTSVSLDVDLSEAPGDLAAYADREGFDWRFAMADADLYRLLQERFGVAATNPPSTPLIVIEADRTVRPLEFGRGTRSAEELLAELGAA